MSTSHAEVRLIDCTEAEHSAAILDILNDAIVNSTALYDYHPRPPLGDGGVVRGQAGGRLSGGRRG